MSENSSPIFTTLGLSPMLPPKEGELTFHEEIPEDPIKNPSLANDFAFARENLRMAIEKGAEALEQLKELAVSSQHPLMFSALASVIASVSGASDKLMKAHTQHKALVSKVPQKTLPDGTHPSQGPDTINNNNIFVGSTEELAKIIKQMKENNG
jgi:hypothetical protein